MPDSMTSLKEDVNQKDTQNSHKVKKKGKSLPSGLIIKLG